MKIQKGRKDEKNTQKLPPVRICFTWRCHTSVRNRYSKTGCRLRVAASLFRNRRRDKAGHRFQLHCPHCPITPDKKATPSAALYLAENSLGDIWDSWSGKTSFEFLDGDHGDGSPEHPFLIKNKEQLMGLSESDTMGW